MKRQKMFVSLLLIMTIGLAVAMETVWAQAPGTIITVAGDGYVVPGDPDRHGRYAGDGGPATLASFNGPSKIVVDGAGNLYIADAGNHRIRKVNVITGTISTFAGDGTPGFSGDGGPATLASLYNPSDMALDGTGNLYIADQKNNRIRKVDTNGIITTVVDGLNNPSDVFVDGAGNLYISDHVNNRIVKWDGTTLTVIISGLNRPRGIVVDGAGNLYIADRDNFRIKKVSAGGSVTIVAGTGVEGFSGDGGPATLAKLDEPDDVALDEAGNLYIADWYNNRVRKVDTNGIITTVVGSGPVGNGNGGFAGDGGQATEALLNGPTSVSLDGSTGDLYIADYHNQRIRKVNGNPPPPQPIELALDHVPGPRGGTATVSVTLRNPNTISVNALQFRATPGDPDHIHFDHVINTVGDIGFAIDAETIDGVTTVVIHPDLDPLTDALIPPGERLVCQLVYRVDETLSDGTVIPLHLDQIVMSDAFGEELPNTGQDGSIIVGERRGDLTHDGNINVRDLVLLIRILLGKDPYPAPGTSAFFVADGNGDGAINVADAVYIINVILGRVSKPIVDGPTSPVAVSLGDIQTLESGQAVIPVIVQSDGAIAGVQATFTFDPALVQIETPQLAERASGMTLVSHVQDRTLRLVMYSVSGQGIVAGNGPAFLLPVTVLEQSETSSTLVLSQVVLANHQAQVIPVTLGTSTVKVAALPTAFALKPNRPNPFNPTTRIAYDVPQSVQITLAVYNLLGQEVVRLVDAQQTPGRYEVTWDGRNGQGIAVASGVYLYRLTTSSGFTQTRRMTLLK